MNRLLNWVFKYLSKGIKKVYRNLLYTRSLKKFFSIGGQSALIAFCGIILKISGFVFLSLSCLQTNKV